MRNKTLAIMSVIAVIFIDLVFIKGMPEAEKTQCSGKNQFYAFGGKIYACKNYQEK